MPHLGCHLLTFRIDGQFPGAGHYSLQQLGGAVGMRQADGFENLLSHQAQGSARIAAASLRQSGRVPRSTAARMPSKGHVSTGCGEESCLANPPAQWRKGVQRG